MRYLCSAIAAAAALLCLCSPAAFAQKSGRNVVLIIADDMGLDAGCYGNSAIKTPNIDRLARQGILFTQAYSTTASCSASRGTILTGLYTHQNGQFGHAHLPHGQNTFPWVQTLPFLLRQAGYYTGLIGKFHVAPDAAYPFDALILKGTGGNRDPAAMTERARDFLKQADKKPFFLVFASSDPHRGGKGFGNEPFRNAADDVRYDPKDVSVPYFLPDRPEVRKELAEYYEAVSRFDQGVGMLLKLLGDTGHAEDTLIILISDNGIPFPGAKTTLYASGTHLPLIVQAPGHKGGHANNALTNYVDLAPTILDWCAAKGPKYKLPGRSLLPILDDENPKGWDETFGSHQFHEITMYYPMRSIQTRRHKYIVNLAHKLDYPFASDLWASQTWQGILKRGDTMMGQRSVDAYLHRPKEELYDTQSDPNELKNLAADPAHAEVLQDLRSRVRAWQRATDDAWTILYEQQP